MITSSTHKSIGLQSNLPLGFILQEQQFELKEAQHIILSSEEPITRSIKDVVAEYQTNTKNYWYGFCKNINLPFQYQKEVLRCSMLLRLLCFDGNID